MKIWFQNHRYKTKRARHESKTSAESIQHPHHPHHPHHPQHPLPPPRRVAVPVLVRDGRPCPSGVVIGPSGGGGGGVTTKSASNSGHSGAHSGADLAAARFINAIGGFGGINALNIGAIAGMNFDLGSMMHPNPAGMNPAGIIPHYSQLMPQPRWW